MSLTVQNNKKISQYRHFFGSWGESLKITRNLRAVNVRFIAFLRLPLISRQELNLTPQCL